MRYFFTLLALCVLLMSSVSCGPQEEANDPNQEEQENNAEQEEGDTQEQEEEENQAEDENGPKNVIVMIADGMGTGQMEVARLFEHGREGELFMETLPHVALSRTYSADFNVTDSAAAGTALANGDKTNNGMIGVGPDGEALTSILDIYHQQGKTVGVISTNTVTDATPAAYIAKVEDRWAGQGEIARQLYENEYDIAMGGGEQYFTADEQDGEDLVASFEEKGYEVVHTNDELQDIEADAETKILGLFHESYMNYVADREYLDTDEPSLLEMSEKAINTASQNEDGFFLMIEGARVDHAAHAADFGGIWREMIEFDQAVEYAVDWAEQDEETLVIVKSDHETMGIAATEPMDIEALKEISVSPEYMAQQLEFDEETESFGEDDVRDVFAEYANIELSDEQLSEFMEHVLDPDDPEGRPYPEHLVGWEIGSIIANEYHAGAVDRQTRDESESTGGHTANMVPVFAYGVGADQFDGVLDNTEIPRKIVEISGYEFEVADE